MPLLHGVLAALVAIQALVLSAALMVPAVRRRGADVLAVLALGTALEVVVAAGVGVLLVVSGHRPHAPLHYLYAAVSVIILPAGTMYGRRLQRPALYMGIAGVVLALLVVRLYATA